MCAQSPVSQGKTWRRAVFTNSSHGTYVADETGDEACDEAICPYDIDQTC